jgi:hypothetical protein
MLTQYTPRTATRVSVDLLQAIAAIRAETRSTFPTVLSDCGTGVLLPGLGGARVYCGHWGLTDFNRRKIVVLSRLGFLDDGQTMPAFGDVSDRDVAIATSHLRDQIAGGAFEYFVVRKRQPIYRSLVDAAGTCLLRDGTLYAVFKKCPTLTARLGEIASASHNTP